jgi:hypothetical protein
MIGVRAVRKVQAGDVHAEAKQVAHRGFGVAGRADGADDLGPAGSAGTGESRPRNLFANGACPLEFWLGWSHEFRIGVFDMVALKEVKIIVIVWDNLNPYTPANFEMNSI